MNENLLTGAAFDEAAAPFVRRVFVGRDREIAELAAGLDDVLAGRGRLFLLFGEPGVGKTRLADEIAVRAEALGIPALWGRCWDGGDAPVFWPWIQVIRSYLAEHDPERTALQSALLDRLVGVAGDPPHDSEVTRFQLFDAAATLLRQASFRHPLLIVLDDLHVADAPSFRLLEFLARQLRGLRLMIVGTYRDAEGKRTPELSRALGNLAREGRYISLRGLEESEVGDFISEAVGKPPRQSVVRAIYETTEGNPLFVDEIVRLLVAEGRLQNGHELRAGALGMPQGLREALRRRIEVLSTESKRVLSVASVIGREFGVKLLENATGWDAERLLDALQEAEHYDIVVELPMAGGYYSFSHVLVRDTFYSEVPLAQRIDLHHQIGQALETLYDAAAESHLDSLAHHFFQAISRAGSAKAIRYCVKAAERNANLLAHEAAAEQYERALAALALDPPIDPHARFEVLLGLGAARAKGGDPSRACGAFDDAVKVARNLGEGPRFARAVLALATGPKDLNSLYRSDTALVALLDEALDGIGPEDSGLRARVLGRLAVALQFGSNGSAQARVLFSREAIEVAERLGDPTVRLAALLDRQISMHGPDNLVERTEAIREVVTLASATGDREMTFRARQLGLVNCLEVGDPQGVNAGLEACAVLAQELRQPTFEWQLEALRGMKALLDGRFEDAEQLGEAVRVGGGRAQSDVARDVCAAQRLVRCFLQGRLAELESSVRARAEENSGVAACRAQLAFLYSELAREAEARNELERVAKDDFRDLPRDENWFATMWFLSMTAANVRDSRRAAALYEQLLPFQDRCFVAPRGIFSQGSVAGMLGLLAAVSGMLEDAAGHFETATRRNAEMDNQPFQALTLAQYANMLLVRNGPGDHQRARDIAKRAVQLSDSLGMPLLKQAAEKTVAACQPQAATASRNSFYLTGDFWTISYEFDTFHLKDSIGLRYIAYLLRVPGRKTSATDIVLFAEGIDADLVCDMSRKEVADLGLRSTGLGDAGEVLDSQAEKAYRRRFEELEMEIREAREFHDLGRVERLTNEREFLLRELTAGVGVNGRSRKVASIAERARLNVTRAIRAAIERIGEHSRPLAAHLGTSIETGKSCSYRPDPRFGITWSL